MKLDVGRIRGRVVLSSIVQILLCVSIAISAFMPHCACHAETGNRDGLTQENVSATCCCSHQHRTAKTAASNLSTPFQHPEPHNAPCPKCDVVQWALLTQAVETPNTIAISHFSHLADVGKAARKGDCSTTPSGRTTQRNPELSTLGILLV